MHPCLDTVEFAALYFKPTIVHTNTEYCVMGGSHSCEFPGKPDADPR